MDIPEREVRMRRLLPRPPVEAWKFLVSPDGLERWLGRPDRSLDSVGSATVAMRADEGEVIVEIEVERVQPPHTLSLLWRWPGEAASLVELTLEPSGTGSLLLLRHARLDAAVGEEYRRGWVDHLDRLASALGGVESAGSLRKDDHDRVS